MASVSSLVRSLRSLRPALAVFTAHVRRIEARPIADGSTRKVKVSVPMRDADGKVLRGEPTLTHPRGAVMREQIVKEVPVTRSAQYRKAVKHRRNAAKRIAAKEAAFYLALSTMEPDAVKAALRTLYASKAKAKA